jgi:aminoglycoside phosphotransferase (APT) family kinase protein
MASNEAPAPQDFSAFEGTRPVNERQQFDTAALTTWLETHVDRFAGPLSIEQFAGGQSNPTFKLITPARCYVMRSKPGPVAKLLPGCWRCARTKA